MSKSSATFTLRDLNRRPGKVLDAVRKFGSAEILTRGGEVFTVAVKIDEAKAQRSKTLPDFKARWKKLRESGNIPPSLDENERIDRIVASDE